MKNFFWMLMLVGCGGAPFEPLDVAVDAEADVLAAHPHDARVVDALDIDADVDSGEEVDATKHDAATAIDASIDVTNDALVCVMPGDKCGYAPNQTVPCCGVYTCRLAGDFFNRCQP